MNKKKVGPIGWSHLRIKLRKLDLYGIRLYMASKGWYSHDRLSDIGWGKEYGYHIWFERWDWHGKKCDKICYHASTPLHGDKYKKRSMNMAARRAAELALRVWETFGEDELPAPMNAYGMVYPRESYFGKPD